jgi:hypothetical protein
MNQHNKQKPIQGELFSTAPATAQKPALTIFNRAVWPYIHSGSTTKTLELQWLAALVPAFTIFIYNDSTQLTVALCAVAGSVIAEISWRKFNTAANDRPFIYALYNGLLASILLPPDIPWWLVIAGMMLAISLTYIAQYKLHSRMVNPALLMAAALSLIYPFSFQEIPIAGMPLLVAIALGAMFLAISKATTLLPSLVAVLMLVLPRCLTATAGIPATAMNVSALLFLIPDYDGSPLILRAKLLQALAAATLTLALSAWTTLAAPLLIALLITSLLTPALDLIHAR